VSVVPGQNLGQYRIVEQLGRGGMATVYKAFQPSLSRQVAIKVLPEFFAEDPTFHERFRQEAMAIAGLRHPNILSVFDSGEADGVAYIVTELVDGGTLADQLGKPLPIGYCLGILRAVGSALDYAHSRDLLHRDVKPSNILLTRDGTPVLSDFGLARMMTAPGQSAANRLTVTGTAVGTPEYMAPEQASEGVAGPAADLYSLAVVLYEMLTGSVPYAAETPLAVLLAHANKPLPLPRERNPELSEAVQEVLLKGLAKEPADRFRAAGEIARALELAAAGQAATHLTPGMQLDATPTVGANMARLSVVQRFRWSVIGPTVVASIALLGGAAFALSRDGQRLASVAPPAQSILQSPQPTLSDTQPPATQPASSGASRSPSPAPAALPPRGPLLYEMSVSPDQHNTGATRLGPSDKVRYLAGALELEAAAQSRAGVAFSVAAGNFVAQMRVRPVQGDGEYSLMFHEGSNSSRHRVQIFRQSLDIQRWDDPNVTHLTSIPLKQNTAKDSVWLAVSALGPSIDVYVDGIKTLSASDSTATQGTEIRFSNFGSVNASAPFVVRLSDVRIYAPLTGEGQAAAEATVRPASTAAPSSVSGSNGVIGTSPPPSDVSPSNLLLNASFEDGEGTPTNWIGQDPFGNVDPQTKYNWDSSTAHSGRSSISIQPHSRAVWKYQHSGAPATLITIPEGATIVRASVWCKSDKPEVHGSIQTAFGPNWPLLRFLKGENLSLSSYAQPLRLRCDREWTENKFTQGLTSDLKYLTVWLEFDGPSDATVWFDDVSLGFQ
jgi:serine/threonine-protein kinase